MVRSINCNRRVTHQQVNFTLQVYRPIDEKGNLQVAPPYDKLFENKFLKVKNGSGVVGPKFIVVDTLIACGEIVI